MKKINFQTIHVCDKQCRKKNTFHCNRYLKRSECMIDIANYAPTLWNFNKAQINDHYMDPNEIVINKHKINLVIHYPLTSASVTVCSSAVGYFTRKDLVDLTVNEYKNIYKIENKTATEQIYDISLGCKFCKKMSIKDYDVIKYEDAETNQCSICLEDIKNNDEAMVLKCAHIFHHSCASEWLKTHEVCPLCRDMVFLKEKCSLSCCKKGRLELTERCTELPINLRTLTDEMLPRNRTNGKFGIYDYYLEDLMIDSFTYDRERRAVYVNIKTIV